jgi:hypothetical protein
MQIKRKFAKLRSFAKCAVTKSNWLSGQSLAECAAVENVLVLTENETIWIVPVNAGETAGLI